MVSKRDLTWSVKPFSRARFWPWLCSSHLGSLWNGHSWVPMHTLPLQGLLRGPGCTLRWWAALTHATKLGEPQPCLAGHMNCDQRGRWTWSPPSCPLPGSGGPSGNSAVSSLRPRTQTTDQAAPSVLRARYQTSPVSPSSVQWGYHQYPPPKVCMGSTSSLAQCLAFNKR